jgi:hypothetical protein
MRRLCVLLVSVLSVICSLNPISFADENKDALKETITAKYGLTKVGWDSVRITDVGPVYVIKADGINADKASDATMIMNDVVNNKVQQPKGMMASMFSKQTTKQFKPGDRVYLRKIDIKNDGIVLWLITVDTFDITDKGSTKQMRYKAVVHFPLTPDVMEAKNMSAIQSVVDPIVQLESEAKAPNTKTIELGQTLEQVEAILGRPEKIVKLGAKTTYVYKDMKVVFTDGAVSDVQ